MKQLFTVYLFLLCSLLKGQEIDDSCYHKFERFNYNFAEKILFDSIWIGDSVFKKANFNSIDIAKKVKIIVIPYGSFNKTVENKTEKESFLNYLNFSSTYFQGFVEFKGEFKGYISARYDYDYVIDSVYLNSLKELHTLDSTKTIFSMKKIFKSIPPKKWTQSENEFGINLTPYNHWKSYYNTIKTNSTNYFFTANPYIWEIWLLRGNEVYAKSIFTEGILPEKDIIKGIRKSDLEGEIWYYYDYVDGLYKN